MKTFFFSFVMDVVFAQISDFFSILFGNQVLYIFNGVLSSFPLTFPEVHSTKFFFKWLHIINCIQTCQLEQMNIFYTIILTCNCGVNNF